MLRKAAGLAADVILATSQRQGRGMWQVILRSHSVSGWVPANAWNGEVQGLCDQVCASSYDQVHHQLVRTAEGGC